MTGPVMAGSTADNSAMLRENWLGRLNGLFALVREWAEARDWSTRTIPRTLRDPHVGAYEAPALLIERGTTLVLLDPVARSTPGTGGVVDLYLLPGYLDIATLDYVGGQWRLHPALRDAPAASGIEQREPVALDEPTFVRVLDEAIKQEVARADRRPGRVISWAWSLGLSSFLAAVVSVTLAYWFLAFQAFVLLHFRFGPPTGQTWRSFIYGMTEPFPATVVSVWIAAAALTGGIGYGTALLARREGGRRLPESAGWFARAGLVGVGLDVLVLGLMVAYLWLV
jgi:hypothetical protein